MYFNNIHILYYVLFTILGIIAGQISAWCINRMPEHKKVLSKDFFKEFKPNYILMIITTVLYLILLSMSGIKNQFLNNIQLIKFTFLTPMLIIALVIDYKYQIIPNRLNMIIFETGLVFAFLSGLYSMNLMTNSLLGMLLGGRRFPYNNSNWRINCRKRSNGIWRRKVYGSIGTLLWINKYYNNFTYGISFCSSYKYFLNCNKNKKEKRIHTIWTIYSYCFIYKYASSIYYYLYCFSKNIYFRNV